MRRNIALFIGFVVLFSALIGFDQAWSTGDKLFGRADHAEFTHPDIFNKFRAKKEKKVEPTPAYQHAEKEAEEEPDLGRKEIKDRLIPLDELDRSLVQRVFFDYDKSFLKVNAKKGVEINSSWLKKHPEYDILLEGHCDERGSNEYNLALGERRAVSVRKHMVELGIAPERITIRSWGEEKPLDHRSTQKAYALNRRVEFYAIPLSK